MQEFSCKKCNMVINILKKIKDKKKIKSTVINTRQIEQPQTGQLGKPGLQARRPASKDPLKAENPQITAKPLFGFIESPTRYHESCKYQTPLSSLQP